MLRKKKVVSNGSRCHLCDPLVHLLQGRDILVCTGTLDGGIDEPRDVFHSSLACLGVKLECKKRVRGRNIGKQV